MKAKVYIAGPYTHGDVAINVKKAFEAANELSDYGFAPYVPHYTHFWHLLFPRPYEFWLELDKEFLSSCNCVLRLSGISKGADQEEELAKSLQMPIFYSIKDIVEHYQ